MSRIFPEWKVLKLSLDEPEGVPGAEREDWTMLEGAFVLCKCARSNESRGDLPLQHLEMGPRLVNRTRLAWRPEFHVPDWYRIVPDLT
jgi:hypothetical protein